MKLLSLSLTLFLALSPISSLAQSNGCKDGYSPGTDTVIYTVPYTYQQVLSIIGSFRNITWSGSPYNTVTLNGTDNIVGTARTYSLSGAHVVETITVYSKPPNGPYEEIHTVEPLTVPAYNVSFYSDYDGTTVVPICAGKASTFNFTIDFCANNATLAAGLLHQLHMTDAMTVGVFLGNTTFESCAALEGNATTTGAPSSTSSGIVMFTGAAVKWESEMTLFAIVVGIAVALI